MDDRELIRLPEAFLRRVEAQLGNELPSFLCAMDEPPLRGLRMNPFRAGGDSPFRDAKRAVAWTENAWEIPLESQAGITAAHEAGAFYLQEPCAMIPASVMAAQPGERILDLCAAPGGKSTQMGLAMKGEGLLVCNDPVPQRAAVLSRNVERMGIPHAAVTCAYPEKLAERWQETFDGVLVDAPCSGEGMFRRHPETRLEWSADKAEGCAARQKGILKAAAEMVRPGGRLVYSTCTWNPAENEDQIMDFLQSHPDFEPAPFSLPGVEAPEGMYTCWLHRNRGEGQFIALLRSRRPGGTPRELRGADRFRPGREEMKIWKESGIRTEEPNAGMGQLLTRIGPIPDLEGISVLRLGLHLATVRGKNLIPDHAAAMAIHPPAMPAAELSDGDALRYLAGEAISGDMQGWGLMSWRGLILGWGKGSGGLIRNHYPKGLRNGKLIV